MQKKMQKYNYAPSELKEAPPDYMLTSTMARNTLSIKIMLYGTDSKRSVTIFDTQSNRS